MSNSSHFRDRGKQMPRKVQYLNKVTQRVKGLVLKPSVLISYCYVTNIHKSQQLKTPLVCSHAQTCKLARACWLRRLFPEEWKL